LFIISLIQEKLYLNIFEVNPDDYATKIDYAISLLASEKPREALPILQSLPEELKENVQIISLIGSCFVEIDKPDLAIEALEKGPTRARKMDQDMMVFRYALGTAYKKAGLKDKALNTIPESLR